MDFYNTLTGNGLPLCVLHRLAKTMYKVFPTDPFAELFLRFCHIIEVRLVLHVRCHCAHECHSQLPCSRTCHWTC